jgi:hypothetical protein
MSVIALALLDTYASMAWVSESTPTWEVRAGGQDKVSS